MADVTQLTTSWQSQLGTVGVVLQGLAEIDQSIRLIIVTQKGSVPLSPDFGVDWLAILDGDVAEASAAAVREVDIALRRFEPRARVTSIMPRIEESSVRVLVKWLPVGSLPAQPRTVEAAL